MANEHVDDLVAARNALEIGDHGHAAFHVACALAEDARVREVLDLADAVLRAAPEPAKLCTPEPGSYFGLVAFHARAAWHVGDRDRAVRLLGNVIAAAPNPGYATWLAGWVREVDPVLAVDGLDRAIKGVSQADERGKAELVAAAAGAAEVHRDNDTVATTHVRVLRACGRVAEALARAIELDAKHRTYMTGVVVATTKRVSGDVEGAVEHLRGLIERFPDDNAIPLDLGDNLLDLDRFDEAGDAYEMVTKRMPHHAWARPSLFYARYLATNEARWRDELEDLAQVADADRARSLARSISPYIGFLPSRRESILNIGEQLRESPPQGRLTCAQSSLEAPSAVAAVDRFFAAYGGGLDISANIPTPDPREPRRPVEFATWRYDGVAATPAMPPPPRDVCDALAELASTRFDGPAWFEHANLFGPERAADIIAAMVHGTGDAPSWASPFQWRWRTQFAGALVLARLDDGWDGSTRRRALMSLVDGPVDWLSAAALAALARACDAEPALVPPVTVVFEDVLALEVTPIHMACLISPATELLAQLPGASPAQRAARRARRAEL